MSRIEALNAAKRDKISDSDFPTPKNILLFVCTGNTCRSPIAQALFNHRAEQEHSEFWFAKSAGLAAEVGSAANPHAVKLLSEQGIALSDHVAKQLSREMMSEATLVLTMNSTQRDLLSLYFKEYSDKIFSISEFTDTQRDIADPFGGGEDIYAQTIADLVELNDKIFDKLANLKD